MNTKHPEYLQAISDCINAVEKMEEIVNNIAQIEDESIIKRTVIGTLSKVKEHILHLTIKDKEEPMKQ